MKTQVFSDSNNRHAPLPALSELFAQAKQQAINLKVIIFPAEAELHLPLSRRRHDIKGALRTLSLAQDALAKGYHFDDDRAAAKIKSMEKALAVLSRELDDYVEILQD